LSTRTPTKPVEAVTEQLRAYATRGVFREFSVRPLPGNGAEYRFVWLTNRPIRASYRARSSELRLTDLLPGIPARSRMDRELRAFLTARRSPKLPVHRRISRKLIPTLRCVNRRGKISVHLTLSRKNSADATRLCVQLISEIFQGFLMGPYHEYMVTQFELRED
jgi:hypothetical protein